MGKDLGAPNRATRHTLIRDIAAGPNGDIRMTETMDVEIIWPADRSGWNAGGGDWRVLNPPPIGYYVTGSDKPAVNAPEFRAELDYPGVVTGGHPEPSMEALKQDEISRQYQRDGAQG